MVAKSLVDELRRANLTMSHVGKGNCPKLDFYNVWICLVIILGTDEIGVVGGSSVFDFPSHEQSIVFAL